MQAEKLKDGKRKHFLGNSLTIKTKMEMKKNLFMVAAVALFAAVSCNDQLSQDVTPAGETVTFVASADGANTKVALDGKVSKWESGDKITIHNGTKGYVFSTTDAGSKASFSYTGNDFSGEKFMAVYPSGSYTADVEARTVNGIVIPEKQVLVAESLPASSVFSVAYTENMSLSFKNAVAILKFKVTGDDVKYGSFYADGGKGDLTGKFNVAYNEGNPVLTSVTANQWVDFHMNDAVLSKDATYYIAVAPAKFATGFGISLNGVEIKKHMGAFTLERNHIYDLGTLEFKVVDPSTLSWGICGDMTDWADNKDIAMTLEDGWFVAKDFVVKANQYFKFRANGSWNVNRGAEGESKVTVTAGTEVNLCYNGQDMTVAAGTYNVFLSKDCSKCKLEAVGGGSETPEVTPGETSPWSVSGTFNSWGDKSMVTTTAANVFVAEGVKLDAYASLKVRKNKAWTENYGGGIVYLIPNNWMTVYSNGSDISVTAAGTYDIYFDYANKRLYVVTAGSDYKTAAQQTKDGPEPEVEEPEVTEKMLYLKPNANWKQDNARFAAYFFGNGEKWVSMTDSDKDGIYEVYIPEGFDYGCSVIFCRMNPATSANNWNNKWNQTADLKAPTDGKNLYTVKDGTWDKGGGTWSVK